MTRAILSEHRCSKGTAFVSLVAVGLLFGLGLSSAANAGEVAACLLPVAALAWWFQSLRLSIYRDGLVYRSLFGTIELQWDCVDALWLKVERTSVNFIPVGTYYRIAIRSVSGKSLTIGNSLAQPEKVASLIQALTLDPITARVRSQLREGHAVSFGGVFVSEANGLTIDGAFSSEPLSLSDIVDHSTSSGTVRITKMDGGVITYPLHKIANWHVLDAVLRSYRGESARGVIAADGDADTVPPTQGMPRVPQVMRRWTHSKSQSYTDAILVQVVQGKVLLQRTDGHKALIRLNELSCEDQKYIQSMTENAEQCNRP